MISRMGLGVPWINQETVHWLGGLVIFASLGTCTTSDKTAAVPPAVTVATDAYYPVTIADACTGGQGRLDFCRRQELVRIDRVRTSHAGIATIHPASDLPAGVRPPDVDWVLRGAAPGRATVTIEATFDDGSVRSGNIAVTVERIARAEPVIRCLSGSTPVRFPAGDVVNFSLRLNGGPGELAGALVNTLSSAGLVQQPDLRTTRYRWVAPAVSEDVALASPQLPGFRLTLGSYLPAEVSISGGRIDRPQVNARVNLPIHIDLLVRGAAPCAPIPLEATTKTPAVCTGPNGETSWTQPATGNVVVRPVASGTCGLSVGVTGTATRRDIDVSYQLLP